MRTSRPSSSPMTLMVPSLGWAPSATTTMQYRRPEAYRFLMRSTTRSMSYGISGSRMTWALPATPACMAIQPA